jgi:hypothetical protein
LENESEGHPVAVLPILGPEGHFLRQTELENWTGLAVTKLYAVYQVAEGAYSSANYPAGEYAIVFIGRPEITTVTLQVSAGKIVRIDYGIGNPPDINENDVAKYLLSPPGVSE